MFRRKAFLHWYTGEGMDEMVCILFQWLDWVVHCTLFSSRNSLKPNRTWTILSANTNNTKMPRLKVRYHSYTLLISINIRLLFLFCRRRWRWWRRRWTRRCLNQPMKKTKKDIFSIPSSTMKFFFLFIIKHSFESLSLVFFRLYHHLSRLIFYVQCLLISLYCKTE